MWDKLPPLDKKKNPAIAFVLGCLFGGIGIGLYFWSFLDFLVPVVVLVVATIAGFGIGAIPGWLFAGFWGMMRAIDSNHRNGY
jgi:hypothetical protein